MSIYNPFSNLRDYFAAMAMQGILAGPCSRDGVSLKEWSDIPPEAYRLADLMIAARDPSPAQTKGEG